METKMTYRIMSGDELIAAMKMPAELLTFDEAMAVLRRMGESSSSSLWPTLNGNECYAFANAAADAYRRKMETAVVK
jgi:hypothetical protein